MPYNNHKKPDIIFVFILAIFLLLAACGKENQAALNANANNPSNSAASQLTIPTLSGFPNLPIEARQQTRSGDPRSPAYWALWNACAEENRADMAEANGGREAGWYLMDDLLDDPGIQLGDLPVTTCQQGLALLKPDAESADENISLVHKLAAQLLAAELNLNLGSETCPAAEEAVLGAHLTLAEVGFDGQAANLDTLPTEKIEAISQMVEMLSLYNTGELCVE